MITKLSEHEPDRGDTQECQGIAADISKILAQAPASVERSESEAPSNFGCKQNLQTKFDGGAIASQALAEVWPAEGQVLWYIAPLASRAQYAHDPIYNFAHIDLALAATFGRGNQRFDMRPFLVRQVTPKAQFVTLVFRAVRGRPNQRPLLEWGRLP